MSGRADPSFTAPAEKFHPAFSHFNRSYSLQSRSLVRLPFTPAWEKAKRGNLHRLNLYSAGGDDQKWQRETLDLNFLYNPHARISNERSSCPEEGGQEKVFYAGAFVMEKVQFKRLLVKVFAEAGWFGSCSET
jgi:hypothetical protein